MFQISFTIPHINRLFSPHIKVSSPHKTVSSLLTKNLFCPHSLKRGLAALSLPTDSGCGFLGTY